MPRQTLAALGPRVRDKRGARRLREVSREIGINPATLLRVESGRIPDVGTFGKLCQWLGADPSEFLGLTSKGEASTHATDGPIQISAHFKAERLPNPETAKALARMILFAAQREPRELQGPGNDDA